MSSKNNQEDLSPIEEIKKEYLEKTTREFSFTSSIRLMKMLEAQKDMNWMQIEIENKRWSYLIFKRFHNEIKHVSYLK